MKSYRNLVESLPSKTTVFAVDSFCPPTTGHQMLVQVVKKLAGQYKANHVIYVTENSKTMLEGGRKLHYLGQMFPDTRFVTSPQQTNEIVRSLCETTRKAIFVTSNALSSQKKLIEQHNGKVFQINDLNLDAKSTALQSLASKGLFEDFRSGLPSNTRSIDARRLMNDLRESMELPAIKTPVNISTDNLRERYFRKEIFNIGDIVESANQTLEIIKRGTNYVICKDSDGVTSTKWLHEVLAT